MVGKTATTNSGITGKVTLVYNDPVASGINQYVDVTMIMIQSKDGRVHHVYPRDITKLSR